MTTGTLIEQLEHKIVMLQHDLKQTRINQRSEVTRLRNQLAKEASVCDLLAVAVMEYCDHTELEYGFTDSEEHIALGVYEKHRGKDVSKQTNNDTTGSD